MAAHRYWKISFSDVQGSGSGETKIVLHDIEMKAVAGGSDVTGSGTPSANLVDAGTSVAALFDAVGNNFWSTGYAGAWVKYDFGAGNDKDIIEITLTTGVVVARSPSSFTVDYSDDDVSWTTAMTFTGVTGWAIGQRRTFQAGGEQTTPGDYGACRHWRIAVTAVEDTSATGTEQPQISEMEYRLTAGGADETGAGTASSGSVFAGGGAVNAFNNNIANQWSANGGAPHWFLHYDFGAGNDKDILEVAIRNTSAHAEDGPKDFVIQRSADGLAWTTATTITGSTGWTAGETRTYSWTDNSAPPPSPSTTAWPVVFVAM